MAQNLANSLADKDKLTVYDSNSAVGHCFDPPCPGVSIAASAPAVVEQSDVIVSMLKEPRDVAIVYDEILSTVGAATPPKVFVDCSTIDVATSLRVAHSMRAMGGHIFIDAPVSGTTAHAKDATLAFMVGAAPKAALNNEADVFEAKLVPLLERMGSIVIPCGGAGLGLIAKLCNNYMLAITNMATSEGFQIAKRLGLDLELFTKIVNESSGKSWSSLENNPVPGIDKLAPAARNYENGFHMAHMRKDLGLALDAAQQASVDLLLGQAAYAAYKQIESDPVYATKDISAVFQYLQEKQTKP